MNKIVKGEGVAQRPKGAIIIISLKFKVCQRSKRQAMYTRVKGGKRSIKDVKTKAFVDFFTHRGYCYCRYPSLVKRSMF